MIQLLRVTPTALLIVMFPFEKLQLLKTTLLTSPLVVGEPVIPAIVPALEAPVTVRLLMYKPFTVGVSSEETKYRRYL